MSMVHMYTEYVKDVEKYLVSKLPDVPAHTLMEIAEYVGNKTSILACDLIR